MMRGGRRLNLVSEDRGAASVEAVLVFPALILLFFAIIQGAVFLHGGNIAQGAALQAYEEARGFGSSAAAGELAGHAAIAAAGGGLESATVTVSTTSTTVTVTVTGETPSLVPGLPMTVERTVTGPIERWSE